MNNVSIPQESPSIRRSTAASKPREKASTWGTLAFFVIVAAVLYQGWLIRDEKFITAESGMGYALGIIGGVLMLLLLFYPLRKRWRVMHALGPVKYWFRTHMIFGVIGPSCILLHSSFHLGALNSNVALFCMLIVAGSGLLGRYFYAKIHHGLYGSQANLQELQQVSDQSKDLLESTFSFVPELQERLQAFEKSVLSADSGLLRSSWRVTALTLTVPWTFFSLLRLCRRAIRAQAMHGQVRGKQYAEARQYVAAYLDAVRKVAEFNLYVRLFSLWHVLHLPLFIMMIITGVVHVIAVHMY